MSNEDLWVKITCPPRKHCISIIQDAASSIAKSVGIVDEKIGFIRLNIEEAFMMVLNLAYSDDTSEDIMVDVRCQPPYFRVQFISKGMPFDLSLIPEYEPTKLVEMTDKDVSTLSMHMIKESVDEYHFINRGKEGIVFELKWHIHFDKVEDIQDSEQDKIEIIEDIKEIKMLSPDDAINISRLVYKSYGLSYVSEDIYYPDRLRAKLQSGLFESIGAITTSDRIVGHLALMKDAQNSQAVEWGVVVVDPACRGKGLMNSLLEFAMKVMQGRSESVFFAHAVTNHPFTQKTCERFGFKPTALLVGFAPDSIRFRNIHDNLKQRESTFIFLKLMRPLEKKKIYPPSWYKETLSKIFETLGISIDELINMEVSADIGLDTNTTYSSRIISSINTALIFIDRIGSDINNVLTFEKKRLCKEKVDVINLVIDLQDPNAELCVKSAESLGFFIAGFTPMMPYPYAITMQYLNNLKIDYDVITTYGDTASWIKEIVKQDQMRVEG
ncbi:MAG: GNAT family N-acetyltransferase [Thermodesulfovibrionales bacterium]|nr:GNAT family N-acetyltransferase [Thermodesulfovibrionales bacterium]